MDVEADVGEGDHPAEAERNILDRQQRAADAPTLRLRRAFRRLAERVALGHRAHSAACGTGAAACSAVWIAMSARIVPVRPSSQVTCVSRSEEHTSELTSLMRITIAVSCLQ